MPSLFLKCHKTKVLRDRRDVGPECSETRLQWDYKLSNVLFLLILTAYGCYLRCS